MNITMKLTNELIFIYQLLISCTKFGFKDELTIKIMNDIIKDHQIDHKLIDKGYLKALRAITKRYSQEYNRLKVSKSCYNNSRMLGLFYTIDNEKFKIYYSYGTDAIVKQQYNNLNKSNNVI